MILFTSHSHGFCLMIEVSFDELYDGADVVFMGTVSEIRVYPEPGGMVYRIVTMEIEKYFKNPLNQSKFYIRIEGGMIGGSGVWVEDQPEFKVGEKVLVFLEESDRTMDESKIYCVSNGYQGKFTVEEGVARRGGGPYLNVTGPTLELMPGGEVVLAHIDIPKKRTVHEIVFCSIGFTNTGGQDDSRYFNISFVGLTSSANGTLITHMVRGGAPPGGYTGFPLELNFSKSGTYAIEVDGENRGSFEILEPGQLIRQLRFSDLIVEPEKAAPEERVNISFRITNVLESIADCEFRLKIKKSQADQQAEVTSNIPMISTIPGQGYDTVHWWVKEWEEGNYTVSVWFRGERVLNGKYMVLPEVLNEIESEKETRSAPSGHVIFGAAITVLILSIAVKKLRGIQLYAITV